MKPFKRTRHGWVWRCSPNEVQLLATLVEQFVDLIAPPPVAAVDDWMSLLQGEMETEPLDRVAGHIPGAVNLPFTDLQDEQGQLLDVEALRQRLGALEPGDAVSCGSGITASYVLLAAEHAGVRGLALYPGSWSDWISDPDRPVATGEGPADGADQRRRGA